MKINLQELARNLEMEEEEFLEIIHLFLETTSADLERLKSAIDERDAVLAAKLAHSLKGASANLGLTELYDLARGLEQEVREGRLEKALETAGAIRERIGLLAKTLS